MSNYEFRWLVDGDDKKLQYRFFRSLVDYGSFSDEPIRVNQLSEWIDVPVHFKEQDLK